MGTMRRLLTIVVFLTMFYQGMAAAYWAGTTCSADPAAHAEMSDARVSLDPCCDGLTNETESSTDCNSAAACHLTVLILADCFVTNVCSSTDSLVTLDTAYRSVEIRDVWRPPRAV